MNRVDIASGVTSALYAAALTVVLGCSAGMAAVMPQRRRDLEPEFDFNNLIDLSNGRDLRKADRKERMKALQAKAARGAAA